MGLWKNDWVLKNTLLSGIKTYYGKRVSRFSLRRYGHSQALARVLSDVMDCDFSLKTDLCVQRIHHELDIPPWYSAICDTLCSRIGPASSTYSERLLGCLPIGGVIERDSVVTSIATRLLIPLPIDPQTFTLAHLTQPALRVEWELYHGNVERAVHFLCQMRLAISVVPLITGVDFSAPLTLERSLRAKVLARG